MLGIETLKERIEITDTMVDCPVRGCPEKVERQQKHFQKEDRFKCPRHNIWISPSTFEYEKEEDNLLWKDAQDLALLHRIRNFKRESRMTRDNSEDAVTWNVFRFLENNNLIEGVLKGVMGAETRGAEIIYWSYSQKENKDWSPLNTARTEFGEEVRRGSEPDIIIRTDNALFLIETKLTARNETIPSENSNSQKYQTGGNGWFKEVFISDYKQVAITEKKYELMRLWLLGTWMAQQTGLYSYVINLVPDGKEKGIEKLFGRHIKETPKRTFRRVTWESIYRYVLEDNLTDKDVMINFFKNKTIGYKGGVLQPAFSI